MLRICLATFLIMLIVTWRRPQPSYVFSARQAERDISYGHVKLITFGICSVATEVEKLSHRYGFDEVTEGCIHFYTPGQKDYDSLVRIYLEARNGPGWEQRYVSEKLAFLTRPGRD
ncbi:MAG: hypothetical protein JWP27_604 [Flaviaesturariibacter sp.]|nr:hypothetical protein [Flaviaesturariibacter sp.]